MLKISFTDTVPSGANIAVIKTKQGDFQGTYTPLKALCDAVPIESSVVFAGEEIANVYDAKCVCVVAHEDGATYQELGSTIFQAVQQFPNIVVDVSGLRAQDVIDVAVGMRLKSYTFDSYKTVTKKPDALTEALFVTDTVAAVESLFTRHAALVDGIFAARDVANEPANILTPAAYANRAKGLQKWGVKVTVLKPKALRKMGMGALLGVAQGSAHSARVVVMEYSGGTPGDAPFAFVGKGVTFDTGGISLKLAKGMEDMKFDMGGSAAVYGAMHAIAMRKAKANVVGVIGLVENMPDGNAQRPGDIVTSMSGQTIEVLNTDAEGRLVLADCLTYVQQTYKPKSIVDLATLTGAMMVALGMEYAGMFANNHDFAKHVLRISEQAGERLWHMPMGDIFDKQIDSPVADMKNISGGPWGGACTAAAFLARFVDSNIPWAHLDIAGTASTNKGDAFSPTGGTGFGVATLDQLVYDFETG